MKPSIISQALIAFGVASCLGFGLGLHAGDQPMCGRCPQESGQEIIQNPGAPKSALQRSAEELISQLAPERESDLLILLNEASQDRLVTIDGIAATRATAIIEARPIQSLTDLLTVKGIGLTTLTRILAYDPHGLESSQANPAVTMIMQKEG